MADNVKHFGAEGVKALWEEALNTFIESTQYQLDKSELEDKIDRVETNGYDDTQVIADIADLKTAVNEVDSKINTTVNAAVSDLVGGAPEAYNTLKEIADYISTDGAAAADLTGRVTALEGAKDQFLTAEEIRSLCAKVSREVILGEYEVDDAAGIRTALTKMGETASITLEKDTILGANYITIPTGKKVTLDLGGKTMTASTEGSSPAIYVTGGELTLTGGTIENTGRIVQVSNGGKVTLEDITVISNDTALGSSGEGSELIINDGSIVNSQEFGALAVSYGTITMNGGTINATDNAALSGNGTVKEGDDRGHVVINFNGGTLNGNITSDGYAACGIYMPNSGEVNVTGGTINVTKGCGILMRAGMLNMTDGEITVTDPTGEGFIGKVGDSLVTVPCAAIVFDEKANYPGAANGEFGINITGGTLTSAEGVDEIVILSDDPENANVIDGRTSTSEPEVESTPEQEAEPTSEPEVNQEPVVEPTPEPEVNQEPEENPSEPVNE